MEKENGLRLAADRARGISCRNSSGPPIRAAIIHSSSLNVVVEDVGIQHVPDQPLDGAQIANNSADMPRMHRYARDGAVAD